MGGRSFSGPTGGCIPAYAPPPALRGWSAWKCRCITHTQFIQMPGMSQERVRDATRPRDCFSTPVGNDLNAGATTVHDNVERLPVQKSKVAVLLNANAKAVTERL